MKVLPKLSQITEKKVSSTNEFYSVGVSRLKSYT